MKKVWKKNEGFSLVELIIVIAIMSILVGVIALAVIPNLERSKESKDISVLDSACRALAVAVSNAGDKAGSGKIVINDGQTSSTGIIVDLLKEQVDIKSLKFSSSACYGQDLNLEWKTENGSNVIKAYAGDGTLTGDYLKSDQGGNRFLKVVGADVDNG